MKKTIIIAALLGMMIPVTAQTSSLQKSPQTLAQEMVQDVTADVQLSAEQTTRLTAATTRYAEAVVAANSGYASDDKALVEAKAAAWKEYSMQMRNILTDEQYATMQVKQHTRREAISSKTIGGQKQ
ncbi:MAG: hypothetical protein IJ776_04270 [Paludibacteraceae bacterium]|nr:hypothetical protein [Paludibacteraceae bacterium]